HRDIKPANVLLSTAREVKIVDFGLAFDAEDKTTLTVAGAVMGTPWYLSPEQAEGRRADQRSDLYSLGVCLYMMVCGVRPLTAESHWPALYTPTPPRRGAPRSPRPVAPDSLAALTPKPLEKTPEKPFQTGLERAQAPEPFRRNTYPGRPLPPPPPP